VTRRSIRRAILLSAALIFLALMLGGCWRQTTPTPGNRCVGAGHWRSGQIWPVTPNVVTPGGAHVDTSGFTVDLADIDARVKAVAECFGATVQDACPVIKIAPGATRSCYGDYLLLPVGDSDPTGCLRKGQTPTPECPCRWRVLIQRDGSIAVPPDLYNLGDALARIFGHVDDPWLNDKTAKCALLGVRISKWSPPPEPMTTNPPQETPR